MFHMGPAALANCTMRASHSEAPLVPQVPPLAAPTLPPTKERAKSTEAVGPGEQLRPGPRTSRVRLCPHAAGLDRSAAESCRSCFSLTSRSSSRTVPSTVASQP